ncbi:hypothetical protein Lepto7375DRAFT_7849 [Leptolyngbya sp. PCC 7375]|nr:hypothetical protein Lepto7375DRAFT_7849 [Leptolyngbya sp. PCC 7375]
MIPRPEGTKSHVNYAAWEVSNAEIAAGAENIEASYIAKESPMAHVCH